MSNVSVFPDASNTTPRLYRAVAGDREAVGLTVGDAVNGVTEPMGDPSETMLILVQPMQPDRFFNAEQIHRLKELMTKWRTALNAGTALPAAEQAELDDLVRVEWEGMIERTKALAGHKAP